MIGDKSFAIEIILKTRENSSRAAKVFENPWCHPAEEGNALQHNNLMLVEILLIFLGPTCERIAMVAKECIAPEFTHDQGLVEL